MGEWIILENQNTVCVGTGKKQSPLWGKLIANMGEVRVGYYDTYVILVCSEFLR